MTAPARRDFVMVLGLWHLGTVTAACLARHYDVVGVDFDATVVDGLARGQAPLSEPGLDDLIRVGLSSGRLRFSVDPTPYLNDVTVAWVCYDTPVDDDDDSDVDYVIAQAQRVLSTLRTGTLVIVSSQLPAGTLGAMEAAFPDLHFACSPENLRLGRAIEAFEHPKRVVIGIRDEGFRSRIEQLLRPLDTELLFMSPESAEMVKHALNAFFALSISFINEVGRLCEHVGAEASEVTAGLKSEPRIGHRAYLGAGWAFAGGTLARDVVALNHLAERAGETVPLLAAIRPSNERHRHWAHDRLTVAFDGELGGVHVVLLGLVYTPNTSTLRRSAAVALCHRLLDGGATVTVVDPGVDAVPDDLAGARLTSDLSLALTEADAVIVCTAWPAFRDANWPELVQRMRRRLVIDPDRFLEPALSAVEQLEYIAVGRPSDAGRADTGSGGPA